MYGQGQPKPGARSLNRLRTAYDTLVEHVGHATYADTVLEWETCLFMRTLPVGLTSGQ